MKSQIFPLVLIFTAALSGAAANLLFKRASAQIFEVPVYQNFYLIAGLVLFSLVLVLFITAFRLGGEAIIVYPAYATTYIWIALLSYKFDGAVLTKIQGLGMLLVILGVSLIGKEFNG